MRYLHYLFRIFGYVEKWLDKKAMGNFKIYDITDWTTNDDNTYIVQYLKKYREPDIEIGHLGECNMRSIFLEKSFTKCAGEDSLRLFYKKSKLSIS